MSSKTNTSESLKIRLFPTLKDCKRCVVPTDSSSKVGEGEGTSEGLLDGKSVGDADGFPVGIGVIVGFKEGGNVGAGDIVGAVVGLTERVGR
jgi:hypothetical protein